MGVGFFFFFTEKYVFPRLVDGLMDGLVDRLVDGLIDGLMD